MVIELCVVLFWSEIILVISNQTHAACSFDFEIKRMISDQIALHSVQLPLLIKFKYRLILSNFSQFVLNASNCKSNLVSNSSYHCGPGMTQW